MAFLIACYPAWNNTVMLSRWNSGYQANNLSACRADHLAFLLSRLQAVSFVSCHATLQPNMKAVLLSFRCASLPDWMLSDILRFLQSCMLSFWTANRNECLPTRLPECYHKGAGYFIALLRSGSYWRSVAVFGSVQQGDASGKLHLFCSCINATGEWKNHWR